MVNQIESGCPKVRELFSELFEDGRSGNGLPRRPAAVDLMKGLVIELHAGVGEVKEPKAQTSLKTSATVIGSLIKALDDYEGREIKP